VLLRACRPQQWVKNLLVAIAPAAAGALTRRGVPADVFGAFVAFCALSSATYLVNDVRDREQDRLHPRKRHRPIASGALSTKTALRVARLLVLAGLVVSFAVRPLLAGVACCYLALTMSYSLWWRHVIVLDVLAVAGGFLLRAVAGGVAAHVALSRSFLIVASACALFLVAGKRYAELADGGAARATLARYSPRLLRLLFTGAAAVGCAAYARWAFGRADPSVWFELSTLPFVLCVTRYVALLGAGEGEVPEELLLRDLPLLTCTLVWAALFASGAYAAP
jgi:decaprenyl-phosphate phosphoribosyltransferase